MKVIIGSVCLICLVASTNAETIFSDNFDNGNWNQWTIGGRRDYTWNANVVSRHDSNMGHLYKQAFSEVNAASPSFDYDPTLNFEFDMEVVVVTGNVPADNYYASGIAEFHFYNASHESVGRVEYIASTTDWRVRTTNDPANDSPTRFLTAHDISGNTGLTSYSLSIADILDGSTVPLQDINSVILIFDAYNSAGPVNYLTTEMWVDNVRVTTVPEPASLVLLGLAAATCLACRCCRK